MNYEALHTSKKRLFTVGIDRDTNTYLLEIVVTWIAWYSRFYSITKEEFEGFEKDPGSLDLLVNELIALKSPGDSPRFFYSQRLGEHRSRKN